VITNQSIVSLAWEPRSGLIFGGSGNYGGGGTTSVEKEAKFFAFDPKKRQKVFETALAPGARNYPATFAANGRCSLRWVTNYSSSTLGPARCCRRCS